MLRVTLRPPNGLDALAEQWRAFEAQAACSFFQSWAWTGCLFGERFDDPLVAEARLDGAVVALALFNRRGGWPGSRRLWLNETGNPAWDAVFVEHNGILLASSLAAPDGVEAVRGCLQAALGGGRAVALNGIDAAQAQAADAVGAVAVARQTRLAPFVDLAGPGSPLGHLSANTRQQLSRSARRYADAAGPLHIARAGSTAEAHAFLDALAVLHQAAWTRRGRPGAFANPAFARFHHALIDRTDAVELLRVTAGGRVVGYLHNFCLRGQVSAYQSGFDYPGAPPHAKPGMTCHHLAIEHYRSRGMHVYDFLAGDDRYKTSLATGSTPLHWLTLAPRWSMPGLAGQLKAGLRRLQPGKTSR